MYDLICHGAARRSFRKETSFTAKARIHGRGHELLLEDEEHNDDGHDAEGRARQKHGPVGFPLLQVFQAHGQRQLVVVVDHQHRPQERVPHTAERQDGRRGNGRLRIWQHDAEKHAQPRTAVDDGGVFQVLGNTEEKLAEEYGVSRMTVNKALMELVSREYLTRIQGSGTYVSKMRREGTKTRGMSFRDSLMKKGFKVDTIVLEKKMVTPNKEVAEILNISITSRVMFLKRLRKVHENPIVVQESYLSSKVSEKLFNVDYNQYSLYDSLKEICQTEIVRAKDTVEAKAATGEVCDWLEAEEGFPVLVARRVAYDAENDPIELSNSIYRSDQYVLEIEYK